MIERLSLIARGGTVSAPLRRRPSPRRRRVLLAAGTGLALLGVTAFAVPSPRLVWNASASAPRGLYLRVSRHFARGDLVLARLPREVRDFAAARGYLPEDVPMVKRVAALQGETVCIIDKTVFVDGRPVALRRDADERGRPLPDRQGCERLGAADVFLLMEGAPDSFDGRYFGAIDRTLIVGRLLPLWTF